MWPFRRKSFRELFIYWDGQCKCYADPLAVWVTISRHAAFDPDVHFRQIAEEQDDWWRLKACATLAGAVREAFGLQSIRPDGCGTTDKECVMIYCALLDFIEALKKNGSPLWTPPRLPEPVSSITPAAPVATDMPPCVPCGS